MGKEKRMRHQTLVRVTPVYLVEIYQSCGTYTITFLFYPIGSGKKKYNDFLMYADYK